MAASTTVGTVTTERSSDESVESSTPPLSSSEGRIVVLQNHNDTIGKHTLETPTPALTTANLAKLQINSTIRASYESPTVSRLQRDAMTAMDSPPRSSRLPVARRILDDDTPLRRSPRIARTSNVPAPSKPANSIKKGNSTSSSNNNPTANRSKTAMTTTTTTTATNNKRQRSDQNTSESPRKKQQQQQVQPSKKRQKTAKAKEQTEANGSDIRGADLWRIDFEGDFFEDNTFDWSSESSSSSSSSSSDDEDLEKKRKQRRRSGAARRAAARRRISNNKQPTKEPTKDKEGSATSKLDNDEKSDLPAVVPHSPAKMSVTSVSEPSTPLNQNIVVARTPRTGSKTPSRRSPFKISPKKEEEWQLQYQDEIKRLKALFQDIDREKLFVVTGEHVGE